MSKAYQARERRLNLWWSLAAIVLLLTAAAVRAQTPGQRVDGDAGAVTGCIGPTVTVPVNPSKYLPAMSATVLLNRPDGIHSMCGSSEKPLDHGTTPPPSRMQEGAGWTQASFFSRFLR